MYLVAVCSCPVGIAHTYMAAANLKKAAQKRGIEIKVETQGAQGVEDEITEEDLRRCMYHRKRCKDQEFKPL